MQNCSYMKRHVILLLLVVMFAATGCDFFRNLAGRPTSEDIVRRKIELMHAEEARLEARLDSLRQAVRTMQDSLNTLDTISSFGGKIMNTSDLGGLFDTELQARYYVIIGSFKSRSNAEALLKKASVKDYAPALVNFKNGMIAVGVCPSDNLKKESEAVKALKAETFCPADVWILVND